MILPQIPQTCSVRLSPISADGCRPDGPFGDRAKLQTYLDYQEKIKGWMHPIHAGLD
jgi:hypothetical protein